MGNVSGCHSLMTPPLLPAKDTVTGLGAKCRVGRQAEARGWPGVSWRGLAGICSLHSGEVLGVSGRHGQRFRLPRTPEPSLCLSERGEGEPAIPNAFPQPARPALRRESRSNNGSIRGSGSCRRPTSSRPSSLPFAEAHRTVVFRGDRNPTLTISAAESIPTSAIGRHLVATRFHYTGMKIVRKGPTGRQPRQRR